MYVKIKYNICVSVSILISRTSEITSRLCVCSMVYTYNPQHVVAAAWISVNIFPTLRWLHRHWIAPDVFTARVTLCTKTTASRPPPRAKSFTRGADPSSPTFFTRTPAHQLIFARAWGAALGGGSGPTASAHAARNRYTQPETTKTLARSFFRWIHCQIIHSHAEAKTRRVKATFNDSTRKSLLTRRLIETYLFTIK